MRKRIMVNPIFVEIWIFINSSTTVIALPIKKSEYIPATVNGIAKNTAVCVKSVRLICLRLAPKATV